jgi:hypothetical protein
MFVASDVLVDALRAPTPANLFPKLERSTGQSDLFAEAAVER